jgi:hypothetical protein
MQITLQLKPKDADVIKRIALSERQTPRRIAQQMLREAITSEAKEEPVT